MLYLYLKSLHLIFIVTWFAGLFYIVRLFVYHVEALDLSATKRELLIEQYRIMERRLWYGITWPSFVLTLVLGLSLAVLRQTFLMDWFLFKSFFLLLLIAYHFYCHSLVKRLKIESENLPSSRFMRLLNEVATLLLFAIIFTVVLKQTMSILGAIGGFIILALALFVAIKIYEKLRKKLNE